jgi:hypothetical protein
MLNFTNIWTKTFLARRGPVKVFGKDVERRERLRFEEAIVWFDSVWAEGLGQAVEDAQVCDFQCALRKLRGRAGGYVRRVGAEFREFVLEGCLFIAQLVEQGEVNQLWFVASSSGGDPRSLLVKFRTMAIREEFEDVARRMGLTPGELAEQVLLGVLRSAGREKLLPTPERSEILHSAEDQ